MKDLGEAKRFLGIEISSKPTGIQISQTNYIENMLTRFNIKGKCSYPLSTKFQTELRSIKYGDHPRLESYRSMVGSLMYCATATRPDISVAVSILSRYLDKPAPIHCDMAIRIFEYLNYTKHLSLHYHSGGNKQLDVYCDASYASDIDFKSISGFCVKLAGGLIAWKSSKQPTWALSTAESELVALTLGLQELVWIKRLCSELGLVCETPVVYEDNQACISLAKNPEDHKRTKHIQTKWLYCRDEFVNGTYKLAYVPTKDQLADLFTKGHGGQALVRLRNLIGLKS